MKGVRTVNDEDLRVTLINVGNIEEVDVVLSERHDRLVVGPVRRLLDVGPRNGGRVGSDLALHIKEVQFALVGDGVEDVGVMVKNGLVRRG